MGKFGKRRLPEFMDEEATSMGANPKLHQDNYKRLKGLGLAEPGKPSVIKIMGNNPADLAEIQAAGYKVRRITNSETFIKILTVWKEEAIVDFDLDTSDTDWDEGMGYGDLVGEHEGVEYRIPVEVNKFGEDEEIDAIEDNSIEATEVDVAGGTPSHATYNKTQMQIDREKRNDPNYYQRVLSHLIKEWEDGTQKPIKISAYREQYAVSDPQSQLDLKTGEITADNGEVIPLDDVTAITLDMYTNREHGYSINTTHPGSSIPFHAYDGKLAEGRVSDSFDQFVNECWSAMPESYVPGLSDSSKQAIKRICEDVLIHEAHTHDMTLDESQNYESYMTECHQYLMECMMTASQKLKV
jgi:hypothetical protein